MAEEDKLQMNAGEDVTEDEDGVAGEPSETLAEEEDELAM